MSMDQRKEVGLWGLGVPLPSLHVPEVYDQSDGWQTCTFAYSTLMFWKHLNTREKLYASHNMIVHVDSWLTMRILFNCNRSWTCESDVTQLCQNWRTCNGSRSEFILETILYHTYWHDMLANPFQTEPPLSGSMWTPTPFFLSLSIPTQVMKFSFPGKKILGLVDKCYRNELLMR